ncbi:MAG: glycosyltransferase [Planctomycetota bacterium]
MYASPDSPPVSVLFPVYKPDPAFLREAVQSILEQDYSKLELVIVEDPSPQPGQATVESFADARVRYHLNKQRTSLLEQLNQGLQLCRGTYVARMDADDIALPARIGKQLRFLEERPAVWVSGTNIEVIDERGRTLGYRRFAEQHEEIAKAMRIYCPLAHPSVMFRRAAAMAVKGYQQEAPLEDWDLWCRMLGTGGKFYNLQEPLLRYRIHPQANKAHAVRKTLLMGIEVKERHFKQGMGTWGARERIRCWLERLLALLPGPLVVKLFLLTLRRQP